MEPSRDDPWAGRTPWLRRRGPRVAFSLLAAGSFLALTLMSTCSTRGTPAPATTTTTTPGIQALSRFAPPSARPPYRRRPG